MKGRGLIGIGFWYGLDMDDKGIQLASVRTSINLVTAMKVMVLVVIVI